MWKDPIVEEIRAHRETHAAKFVYEFAAICRDLRQQQADSNREIVSLPARRVQPVDSAGRVSGQALGRTDS